MKENKLRRQLTTVASILCILSAAAIAQNGEWQPVTGEDNLRKFMSGTTLEWEEPGAGKSKGEYRADGTGTLHTFGASIPRTWEVKGNDQIRVKVGKVTQSWRLERNIANPTLYRSIDVSSGTITQIHTSNNGATATIQGDKNTVGNEGGAAAASASEIAAQLANPSSPLAALNFNLQNSSFRGSLPGADHESSTSLLMQPQFPFPLENGNQVIFRPAVSLLADQPVFDASAGNFDSKTALSDISFDLLLSRTLDSGYLVGAGIFSTLPTATSSDVTSGLWSLGPEVALAKLTPDYVAGGIVSHDWNVAGWGDGSVNRTTISVFANLLLPGGSTLGSNPIIAYDWVSEQWTVPLTLSASKTVILGKTPWKMGFDFNYYVERPHAFGPEWMLSFNIAPVVPNFLANWMGVDKK